MIKLMINISLVVENIQATFISRWKDTFNAILHCDILSGGLKFTRKVSFYIYDYLKFWICKFPVNLIYARSQSRTIRCSLLCLCRYLIKCSKQIIGNDNTISLSFTDTIWILEDSNPEVIAMCAFSKMVKG